jgi:tyrosinase
MTLALNRRQFILGSSLVMASAYAGFARADGTPRLRRNASKMDASDPYFAKYGEAVTKMHSLPASDPRSWRNEALIHLRHCPHGLPDFTHWHRHYILNFERICGDLIGDPNFALAYWDWTQNNGRIPSPFFDLDALNVEKLGDVAHDSSPNWAGGALVDTIGVRGLTRTQGLRDDPRLGGAFDPKKIEDVKRFTDFGLFKGRLESSPHNNAHVISGGGTGHMGDGMSPLDPIFWLHHCNVDRVWAEWQKAQNLTPPLGLLYDGQFVDGKGKPVKASSASSLSVADLGYTYESLQGPQGVPAAQSIFRDVTVGQAPKVLGVSNVATAARATQVADFSVPTQNLLTDMFQERVYRTVVEGEPRLAAESARVLARLRGVSTPETKDPFVVNVWVNCPYVSPDLPYTDKHYAGSFSFFGHHGLDHQLEVLVDLTDPLSHLAGQGLLSDEQIKVQAVAVPVDKNRPFSGTVTIKGIDIIRT